MDWIFRQKFHLDSRIGIDSPQKYDIQFYVFYRRIFDRLAAKFVLMPAKKKLYEVKVEQMKQE